MIHFFTFIMAMDMILKWIFYLPNTVQFCADFKGENEILILPQFQTIGVSVATAILSVRTYIRNQDHDGNKPK